jgi:hypothetical protein
MTSCTNRHVALPHTAVHIFKMSGTIYIKLNIVITWNHVIHACQWFSFGGECVCIVIQLSTLKIRRYYTEPYTKHHYATNWIYDSVYFADMWKIHMIYTCVYARYTHWYILRIEPESHVVYFAYSQIITCADDGFLICAFRTPIVYFYRILCSVTSVGYVFRICSLYTSLYPFVYVWSY